MSATFERVPFPAGNAGMCVQAVGSNYHYDGRNVLPWSFDLIDQRGDVIFESVSFRRLVDALSACNDVVNGGQL